MNTNRPIRLKTAKESTEQIAFVKWCQYHPVAKEYIFSIPNETIEKSFLFKLVKMGLKKGVSDLFLPYPVNGKHGLWIEMKNRYGGKLKKEQKDWINKMNKLGYVAVVSNGWEMAKNLLESYLNGTIKYEIEI